ncbi:phosphatase PAP2 family protein [Variovorax sp. J2P1-59]|uniref:phosphatase PAP2 family protein n=1 Tax=Variovorax flavidus TaxID=3053501 RepID=UPI0025787D41|nr:phosphatase PAP2 family protein [Variovorax sp. J2P1-59]MDM0072843.1 phosphatase PAP2 family protein [Variovorax sp. J2P1-59]
MIPADQQLFLLLNADEDAHAWVIDAGRFLAVHAHWVLLALLAGMVLHRGKQHLLRPALAALLAMALGSVACELIGEVWDRPRPVERGLGHQHLAPGFGPSFPSSHATVYAAVAFSFLLAASCKAIGYVLLVLAGLVGFARVVIGFHYPLDIAAGMAIGGLAAAAAHALIARFWKRSG